jgi:hypothetical protein
VSDAPPHLRVAIVTAASAGSVRDPAPAAGHRRLLVFERAGDLGGAWRDNSCPGCAGDVPSHLCCFSVRAQPWLEPVVLSLDPPKH